MNMKRYTTIILSILLVMFSSAVFAQDETKLSDLLETMITGPSQASDNGSTFENARAHRAGPHEAAFARWQQICYDASAPGKETQRQDVAAQMKEVLAKDDVPPFVKVWLVKQFQWLGTEADVEALVPFLTSTEYTLRDEAIRTISKIPGQKSRDVLKAAYAKANDADKLMIQNALNQQTQDISTAVETAMPLALPRLSAEKRAQWLAQYDQFSNTLKIQTIAALTQLGDRQYLPIVLSAFDEEGDDAPAFKRAGLLALEKLATKDQVPLLIENLAFDRGLVIRVASVIEAPNFDEALLNALGETSDGGVFGALSEILARRNAGTIFAPVVEQIRSADCPNRSELLVSACSVAQKSDVPVLVGLLPLFEGKARDDAEKLIASRCQGDSTVVFTQQQGDLSVILPLLGRIGDDHAWKIIEENLAKADMREVAVRALCNLPNAKHADQMLAIVDGEQFSDSQKIASLRAFIRVVSLPNDQIGISISSAQKLEKLRLAMGKATRTDEKRLILSRLPAIREVASAQFAMEFVNDADLAESAYRAIVDLAHHNNLRRPNAEFFGPALDLVIEKSKDTGVTTRAKKYRQSM
ncbi:MAG: hypothetical protein Q4D38_02565 [Planctomycetia bacterium]|nr:hypothetical protein [Planctomycetia bacterium]